MYVLPLTGLLFDGRGRVEKLKRELYGQRFERTARLLDALGATATLPCVTNETEAANASALQRRRRGRWPAACERSRLLATHWIDLACGCIAAVMVLSEVVKAPQGDVRIGCLAKVLASLTGLVK